MTEHHRSEAFSEGAHAGKDINTSAADCPYDHDPRGEFDRRQDWLAGFASTRGEAASAEEARDYHPIGHDAQISPELPVHLP